MNNTESVLNRLWQFFCQSKSNLIASFQGFIKDDCFSKASSLTFYTLLSIVPILAVAFGIAKGFGFENYLQSVIESQIEQGEIANQLITFSYNALYHAHGGVIASAGLLFLFWTSLQLLSNIELALNEIWEIKTQRSYGRQLSDYIAIIIFCPIFFVLSSSFSIYAITLVSDISQQNVLIKAVSPYLLLFLRFTPFLLNWILFTFLYIVLPNTTIPWRTAIFGGIIAGTLYQIINWIYIHFQIGVAAYSSIYGSFAALPLFLIWVNLSWQVVLLGAEMAYHFDVSFAGNEGTYRMASKKHIGLAITTFCSYLFLQGKRPVTIHEITQEIGASQRVVNFIAMELFEANILAKDQHGGFLPAKNPSELTIKTIFDALEEKSLKYPILSLPHVESYENTLMQFDNAISVSENNFSLKDLATKLYSEKLISDQVTENTP
ncbi:MAG: YihY family inner membrane protein [Parachlamydiaceae bacterium]|nr:YihY family inner membrane protein [Parachlamydiaceae bacterium]